MKDIERYIYDRTVIAESNFILGKLSSNPDRKIKLVRF